MENEKNLTVVGLDSAMHAASFLTSFLHYIDFGSLPKVVHEEFSDSLSYLYEEIVNYENWRNDVG